MSLFASLRESRAPGVAVELASRRVSAAAIDFRGGQPVVAAHASEPLPDGALVPSLTNENIHDRALVAGALAHVFDRMGVRPRRVGLVVPDPIAKVSLIRFEKVPPRAQDLDQLVRWQVRKTAPFPIEEAQVSYVRGAQTAEGQEFVVSLARRAVVEEYEQLCADAGAHAGIVDLATFNVINAVLASPAAPSQDPSTGAGQDWLLVNVAAEYASIAIVRGEHLMFFRNRAAETEGTLADLVHQTAMYYEDRLKGAGFARVVVSGGGAREDVDQVRRSLEERLTTRVDTVDPRSTAPLTDRITAGPTLLDTLAPLVGLLLRDREAA
jgi:type IV pilus assembly protein PilM